jgi:hypothetical protein
MFVFANVSLDSPITVPAELTVEVDRGADREMRVKAWEKFPNCSPVRPISSA